MRESRKPRGLLLITCLLISFFSAKAQVSSINASMTKIKQEINLVNQYADNNQIYKAVSCLDKTNDYFNNYIKNFFEDEYRKAKKEDPSYRPSLNVFFSKKLTAAYWEERVKRSQKSLDLAKQAFAEGYHRRTLDKQDEVWAYLKATYEAAKTMKDVAESVGKIDYVEAVKNAKEGVDGFIDNYKKIEESRLQILNTETYETDINGLIRRAEKMEEANWKFASYLRIYEKQVDDFYRIKSWMEDQVERLNKEQTVDWSLYSWNPVPPTNKINKIQADHESGKINCETLKTKINAILQSEENREVEITNKIYKLRNPDILKKANKLDEDFENFRAFANKTIDHCKEIDRSNITEIIPGGDTAEKPVKTRILTIKSLEMGTDNGTSSVSFKPGQPAKVYISTQWEGPWMDRVQMRVLIDKEPVIDELLIFRDNMGKFRTEFSKDIVIPNNLEAGTHTLSLQMARDPHILNKHLTLNCPAKSISFTLGETENNDAVAEENTDKTEEQEGYRQMFAGSSATTSLIPDKAPTPRHSNLSPKTTLPGHRVKNVFFNGYWDLGGNRQAFKQTGDLVEIVGVGTGRITNGVLVYSFKDQEGISRIYEYHLIHDGFTMQVKKEMTRKDIFDKLYLANGMQRPPKKAEIQNYRERNGNFLTFERTYSLSNGVYGTDTDGDKVDDEFDHCPNTQKGLTVNNGGVNILGCPVGQNPDLQTKTSPENNNTTNSSASHTTSYSSPQQPINTNKYPASSTIEQKPAANRLNTIGTIHTDGKGKGNYLSLKIENINKTDIIELYLISGRMRIIQVIWRYSSGSWSTKYEGTKTRFVASELLDGITKNVTHLNFVVNSYHNFYGKPACKMGITHLTKDGGIPTYRQNTNKKTSTNKESPKGSSKFELLITKATTAFNKPYWKDNNTGKTSINVTNSKQESFNYLKKAATLLNQETNLSKKYNMVYRFTHVASGFAKRVYSNKAKIEFIQLAGNTLSKYSNNISSISKDINGMSAPKARAMAYKKVAEAWRELTSAGLWGNSQYNKMYCDKLSKKYYDLALNEDRNDVELQKTVEKINAPKKPVPQAVKQFEEIEPEVWNKAQDIMVQLEENNPIEKTNENFLPVANLTTLEHSTGKVSVKRSGTEDWEEITDNNFVIYEGDKIRTSADAREVSVTYSKSHTFLAIKPNSIVEFHDDDLFITRGNTYLNVIKRGSKFLVITPTAAVGVRGTQFEVNVKPDKTTETYLYKGVVEVRNKEDIGYLVPGEKIISRKNEKTLKQETFNKQSRLQTKWKELEAEQIRHNHILATVPASSRNRSKKNNAFAGASYGNLYKTTRKSRPPAYQPAKVYISTSPDNQYRPALALKESPYGSLNLVGHCPIHISQNTPITVKWYMNNQPKSISTGQYVAEPKVPYFNGVLSATQAPLLPGIYRVEFIMNNRIIGKGSISIKAPQIISGQDAQQVYLKALQKMQAGLDLFFQGNIPAMKRQVQAAIPGLRKVLYSAPNLPDIYAVYQTANALLALENVDRAVRNAQKNKAKTWLNISSVYTNSALINCQDQEFKISIQKIKMVIDQLSQN